MPKKRPRDINQLAASIVGEVTGETPKETPKDEVAVAMGRRGGLKGGRARADKLTKERRAEIAKKAIAARWAKTAKSQTKRKDGRSD